MRYAFPLMLMTIHPPFVLPLRLPSLYPTHGSQPMVFQAEDVE